MVGDARDRVVFIAIKDSGIGIAPEQQLRMFDRFYCVDGDRARKTGGAGLGLAIVQAIAQKHHAQIKVESKVGQGSVFTVELNY